MRSRWILVLALVLVAVVLPTGGPPTAATGPATIRITTKQVRYYRVDSGEKGRSPGDTEIIIQLLYNRNITPKAIGHSEYVCTFTIDISRSCRATFFLPRGKLVIGGSLRFAQIYQLAVLGGTGLYDNARGTMTATRIDRSPLKHFLLFRLTG
jgi:hypothetical protein